MRIIRSDSMGDYAWQQALADCNDLGNLRSVYAERYPGFEGLLEDLFHLLHSTAPHWDGPQDLTLHEYLLRELVATREFKELRLLAEGDHANATMIACVRGQKLLDSMSKRMSDRLCAEAEALVQMAEALVQIETLETLAAEDPHIGNNTDFQIALQKAQVLRDEAVSKLASLIPVTGFDDEVGDVRRQARKQMPIVRLEVIQLEEAMQIFGGWGDATLEQKLRLADRVKRRPHLKKLVELAGRMRRIAISKKASVVRAVRNEIVGVTLGSEPTKALPSELVMLRDPLLAPLFYKKMVEGQLLMYEQDHKEILGGGPIILCIDGSGSMRGDPDTWAKAVMSAYMAIAEKEKRDFIACQFGGAGQLAVFEFQFRTAPHKIQKDQNLRAMEFFMDAGDTCLETPLLWAADQVKPDTKYGDADIVILTDAESNFSDGFLSRWKGLKETVGFKTYGVLIGSPRCLSVLKQAIDNVVFVQDVLAAGDEVHDVLFRH
jgi:hypothetical protein